MTYDIHESIIKQSEKNAEHLRKLIGVQEDFILSDPKKTLYNILSEYDEKEDSREVLKSFRDNQYGE
jgi:hypothetical protein